MSLPKELNYMDRSELPKGTQCQSIVITPMTGNLVYTQSGTPIQFNLPIRGYLVPNTVYLRYKLQLTANTTNPNDNTTYFNGSFPAYSPFLRMETLIGSNVVESISNYNMVNQLIMTCKTNYGRKFGIAPMFGFGSQANNTLTTATANAYQPTIATVAGAVDPNPVFCAVPMNNLLANSDKLVPLKYMPAVSINLYLDAISNLVNTSAAHAPSAFSVTNMELCFDVIEFNSEIDSSVLSMTDERGKIVLKSQSYMCSQQTTPAVISGTNEFIYSMRLASIKSLFLNLGATHTAAVNKTFDSLDLTAGTGSYQFFISGSPYPSREISTVLNKAGVLAELAMAVDGTADISQANFSITPLEFSYSNNSTTTSLQMGKFFVGTNVERLASSAMLTGISSQLSPISVRIVNSTATTNAQTIALIAHYDALIEIDPINRQAIVLQ
jgi:hypothetical protein